MGLAEGCCDDPLLGISEGGELGSSEAPPPPGVGAVMIGCFEGSPDGCLLGVEEGTKLGKSDGDELGLFVGSRDGRILGSCVSAVMATQSFPTCSQLRHWLHCPLFRPAHVSHIILSRQLFPCL